MKASTDASSESRRNAILLSAAGALNGSAPPIAITLGGLAGLYLLGPDKSLATLPVSGFNLGVALGTIPAALLMRADRTPERLHGRRFRLDGGRRRCPGWRSSSCPVLAVLRRHGCCLASPAPSFSSTASPQPIGGTEAERARAISWVLVGGVASAIIGPADRDLHAATCLPRFRLPGAFFAIPLVSAFSAWFSSRCSAARLAARRRNPQPVAAGRSLEIARQPRFIVAVLCGMGSYALMSLVMTAAPLAMVACGLGETNAALGIQWHVLAMFVPSFFTGTLIARFGEERIVLARHGSSCRLRRGAALPASRSRNFWIALILLGVGWNFAFIGATAMLTETYRPEETRQGPGTQRFPCLRVGRAGLVLVGQALHARSAGRSSTSSSSRWSPSVC